MAFSPPCCGVGISVNPAFFAPWQSLSIAKANEPQALFPARQPVTVQQGTVSNEPVADNRRAAGSLVAREFNLPVKPWKGTGNLLPLPLIQDPSLSSKILGSGRLDHLLIAVMIVGVTIAFKRLSVIHKHPNPDRLESTPMADDPLNHDPDDINEEDSPEDLFAPAEQAAPEPIGEPLVEETEEVVEEFDEADFDHDFDDDFEEEIKGEYDLEDDQYGEEFNQEFGHLNPTEEGEEETDS